MADPDRVDRRAVSAFPAEVRLRAMAAFTAPDLANREAFMARRAKNLADPNIVKWTILADQGHSKNDSGV